ncbi:MAG: ScyD/ScyE family protein [Microthrixaceae bacterium]
MESSEWRPRPRRFGRRVSGALAIALAAVMMVAIQPAGAHSNDRGPNRHKPAPTVKVLQNELSSPRGLDTLLGVPIIGQGAFGAPGPVVAAIPSRRGSFLVNLTEPIGLMDVAVGSWFSLWGLGSDQVLYRKTLWDSTFKPVANIAEYQKTDPDPTDTEQDPTESNPYAVASLPNGDALVADAANNDLLRVSPDGHIRTVARFSTEMVSTDQVPPDPTAPLPPALPAEAVPTSIAVTPKGVLVGELKGFPFREGSSHIWLVNPNATNAVCSVDPAARKNCTEFASGFTGIQDLAYNSRTRDLYVMQIAVGGVMAFEGGLDSGNVPPAVLLEVDRKGHRREIAAGQIFQPGGVAVAGQGHLFVTDGIIMGPGRLLDVSTR